MRERAISSIGVVAVGLLPTFFGGPVFAIVFAILCLIGYSEFVRLSAHLGARPSPVGYLAVAFFAATPFLSDRPEALLAGAVAAVGLPLVAGVFGPSVPPPAAVVNWCFGVAGGLYLGLPLFAAVSLRRAEGAVNADWLRDIADSLSPGWAAAPRGLGWILIVILATWFGDTAAYLVGRSVGRRPLLPRVSPKKTVEGSIGGLAGSMLAGLAGVALFGLDVPIWLGALFGLALGAVGQVGDLGESLLKRQAGVKDSGTLIRGHGGILDRIDALLFALAVGYVLVPVVERWA